jgi:dienelactone hydrolase
VAGGLAVSCIAGAASSCAAPAPGPTSDPTTPTAPAVDTAAAFYADPPAPDSGGRPGDLIRYQVVGPGTYRIMYRTQVVLTSSGVDRVVTVPTSATARAPLDPSLPRPATGWPIIVWGHGTVGMIPECGPSRDPGAAFFHPWLTQPGAWSVAPDYIGLGVDSGLRSPDAALQVSEPSWWSATTRPFDHTSHPYLSPSGAGRAMLDGVRATRRLQTVLSPQVEADPGRTTVAIGLSQGGHAAIAAGEEHAAGYAPEVDLRAVVAAAPPADLDLAELSPSIRARMLPRLVGPMSIQHRDLSPTALMDRTARDRYALTWDSACSTSLPFVLADTLLPSHPVGDDELAALVRRPGVAEALGDVTLGHRAQRVPVLVSHVRSDPTVPVAGSLRYAARARAAGTAVTLCSYPGLTASPSPLDHLAGLELLWRGAPGSCSGPDGRPVPPVDLRDFVGARASVFARP